MENGHLDNQNFNPFEKFATKTEVHMVESQLRELTKDYAGMAVALQNLSSTMEKMNITMEKMNTVINTLMTNKNVNDKLKLYWGKCGITSASIIASITIPILVAHWTGLMKMMGRYILS